MPPLTLSHLKVLELASVLAGPAVGMFFAELGAEVIKIEPPNGGDVTRSWKLPSESAEDTVSTYFGSVNWGKKSVVMDVSKKEEREKLLHYFREKDFDLVIANYKKGSAEKLGLDYHTLSQIKPDLIYGHITGYGTDSERTGFDAVVQAESGFMYLNRPPDGTPTKMPVALMDLLAAHQLKQGLLLALYEKERTGKGRYVTVSLIQAAVSALANQASAWLQAGVAPQPMGSDHPTIVPYGSLFLTGDGSYLLLAVGNDAQFRSLAEVIGLPHLAQEVRFARNPERVVHREALKELLAKALILQPSEYWLERLHRAQVPCGAVFDLPKALSRPEVADLLLPHGLRTVAFDVGQMTTALSPPPKLGEHQGEVG